MADCDGDTTAIGGGGTISGDSADAMLKESFWSEPGGRSWGRGGKHHECERKDGDGLRRLRSKPVTDEDGGAFLDRGQTFNYGDICLSGEAHPTGGGVLGPDLQIVAMRPDTSGPFDWLTSIKNLSSQVEEVTRVWVCTEAYDLRYRSASTPVRGGTAGNVVAHCRRHQAVTGGGLVTADGTPPNFKTWAVATRPVDDKDERGTTPDDGWLARAHNGTTHKLTLTAYAICKA